ncbi:hypothetical protein [Paenibacillus oceani]|uniref:Uncharacterized protein n=1 Tax=Paenibacillus oceani TaxID=2772510 RepID=A0A927GZD0_9BACL|nr:hypothetical protein [Paenibacillus oceani]MBD2861962.1 hypothetical protein [Paenibacillus oceani]
MFSERCGAADRQEETITGGQTWDHSARQYAGQTDLSNDQQLPIGESGPGRQTELMRQNRGRSAERYAYRSQRASGYYGGNYSGGHHGEGNRIPFQAASAVKQSYGSRGIPGIVLPMGSVDSFPNRYNDDTVRELAEWFHPGPFRK